MVPTIAIIGAGNMGRSLISGLIQDGHPPDQLYATDVRPEQLAKLQTEFHIHTTTDNIKAIQAADVVILSVKPQMFSKLLTDLAETITHHKPLIISIAAGVRTETIAKLIQKPLGIVRAMPNTPALIGCGATALYANTHASAKERDMAESILRAVGITVWLPTEDLMDVVTALSGSGPAYFFLIMESLAQGAHELGLPMETALLLTMQTALGAARMAIESDQPLATLRQQVTSPGGTTEAAISALKSDHIDTLFRKALQAAKLRALELSKD